MAMQAEVEAFKWREVRPKGMAGSSISSHVGTRQAVLLHEDLCRQQQERAAGVHMTPVYSYQAQFENDLHTAAINLYKLWVALPDILHDQQRYLRSVRITHSA